MSSKARLVVQGFLWLLMSTCTVPHGPLHEDGSVCVWKGEWGGEGVGMKQVLGSPSNNISYSTTLSTANKGLSITSSTTKKQMRKFSSAKLQKKIKALQALHDAPPLR